jgi:hypothetical protein
MFQPKGGRVKKWDTGDLPMINEESIMVNESMSRGGDETFLFNKMGTKTESKGDNSISPGLCVDQPHQPKVTTDDSARNSKDLISNLTK